VEKKSQEGGGEAVSDYSAVRSVTISFFWMSQWKENFPGEAHVRTQGGWKICIGTEKKRFPGGASEGRSNRMEYPMTKFEGTTWSGSAEVREDWFDW